MSEASIGLKDWIPVIAAFLGALVAGIVAFGVSRVNSRIDRHRERWKMHWNALVQLEYRLNEILGITNDNRHHAKVAISAAAKSAERLRIVWSEPKTLPRDVPFMGEFLRPKLAEALFSYCETLRKLNNDTETLCKAFSEMRSALVRQDIKGTQYNQSLQEFGVGLSTLSKAYDLLDEKTEAMLARVRATEKADRLHDSDKFFNMPKLEEISDEVVRKERMLQQAEIDEVRARSRREIDKYFGDSPSAGT